MERFDSFSGFIQPFASETPQAPALFTATQEEMSYESLARALRHGREAFADLGISKSVCVALVMESDPEIAVMLPLLLDAACCAPLNPAYTQDEFLRYLRELPADVLLVAAKGNPAAEEAATRLEIPVIRLARQKGGDNWDFTFSAPDKPIFIKQSYGRGSAPEAVPSLLLHTSGTTARPKLVSHSLNSILRSAVHLAEVFSLRPSDRCLCVTPFFHAKAVIGIWPASLVSGASVIIAGRFEPQEALGLLQELKATWYTAASSVHQALLGQIKATEGFSHCLRFIRTCAAQTPLPLVADLEATLGVPCVEAYGMTETCARATSNPLPPGLRKPGSAGLPINCEIRIMASDGAVLPPCAVGEVCISGDRVMKGYKNNPGANRAAYFGPWLRTGDQGWLDEDGYLFITGRLKELINKGGQKIAPAEIEEELLRHPDVDQAVVYAMPHPSLGEDVAACVVPAGAPRRIHTNSGFLWRNAWPRSRFRRRSLWVMKFPKGPPEKFRASACMKKLKLCR